MTARAPSVCNVPGCPTLIPAGTSRCPEHGGNQRTGRPRTGTTTRAYRTTRARVLAMHNGRCARCPAPATVVHHIVPVSEGGSNTAANLTPLCQRCHDHAHQAKP